MKGQGPIDSKPQWFTNKQGSFIEVFVKTRLGFIGIVHALNCDDNKSGYYESGKYEIDGENVECVNFDYGIGKERIDISKQKQINFQKISQKKWKQYQTINPFFDSKNSDFQFEFPDDRVCWFVTNPGKHTFKITVNHSIIGKPELPDYAGVFIIDMIVGL